MNYQIILSLIVEIIEFSYPIALLFGITSKMINFSLDMIFNRRIEL